MNGAPISLVGSLVLGLAALALVIYRQVMVRPVRMRPLLPVLLAVIGAVELSGYLRGHHPTVLEPGLRLTSLVVFGVGLGAVRAWTVRIFPRAGGLVRQGTWITVVLWLVTVALHLGADAVTGIGQASILLYLGLPLGVQQMVVQGRAGRIRTAS